FHAGNAVDPLRDDIVVLQRGVDGLPDEMAVDAEYAGQQFGPEAVHDDHDHDQRSDAQHHAEEEDIRDDRKDGLLATQEQLKPFMTAMTTISVATPSMMPRKEIDAMTEMTVSLRRERR